MSDQQHKGGGTYLRFRITPSVINRGVEVVGKATEVAMTANSIRTGIIFKKAAERRARVEGMLSTGRNIADIAGGFATAISKLTSSG